MIGENQRMGCWVPSLTGPLPASSFLVLGQWLVTWGLRTCQEELTPWAPDISFLMLFLFISPCLPLLLPAQLGPVLCQRTTRELALPPQRGLFHER